MQLAILALLQILTNIPLKSSILALFDTSAISFVYVASYTSLRTNSTQCLNFLQPKQRKCAIGQRRHRPFSFMCHLLVKILPKIELLVSDLSIIFTSSMLLCKSGLLVSDKQLLLLIFFYFMQIFFLFLKCRKSHLR